MLSFFHVNSADNALRFLKEVFAMGNGESHGACGNQVSSTEMNFFSRWNVLYPLFLHIYRACYRDIRFCQPTLSTDSCWLTVWISFDLAGDYENAGDEAALLLSYRAELNGAYGAV